MKTQTNSLFRIGNFNIDRNNVLGKGATGFVYKGVNTENNETIAVKAIEMSQVNNQVTQYLLEGQKKALSTIKNPYVISTYDVVQEKDFCYIMMEQCLGGTLKEYIQKKGKLSEDEAIQIFQKIVIGYVSIVQSLFIHRDLKTANIIMRTNGDPVIIDFGYCEMIMGKRPMIQYNVGSPSYMAPESYTKSRYSQKSDIWSLGIILYQMLTGKTPDSGLNIKDYFKDLENKNGLNINSHEFSSVCQELLKVSLAYKPEERATIHKLKYIIDKSLIPKMKVQLRKTHSDIPYQNPQVNLRTDLSTGNHLQPRKEHLNKCSVNLNETKPKSSIKESIKIGENNIEMNKSVIQPLIAPSPKSLLKIQTPTGNSMNSFSKIFVKKSEGQPVHYFQTVTKKKIDIGEMKGFTSSKNIQEVLKKHMNGPTLHKTVSLPIEKKQGYGSLRII